MRIIYYSPHPTHDIVSEVGYATHQREVILALRKAGHEVYPLIMGGTEKANLNPLSSEQYQPSVIKKILKSILPKFIWTSLNNYKLILHDRRAGELLEKEILSQKPDLIYERSEYLQDSGAKAARKFGIKYFLEVNAPFVEEMNEFEGYSLYHSKAHKIESLKLKSADKVFCVSSALSDFLVSRYHCHRDKIIVQPNCINPAKTSTDNEQVSRLRQEWNAGHCRVIGFVGSMFPYHGVDLLINAYAQVSKKFPDTKLLIVGDGVVLNDLKSMCRKLDIMQKVIFTGKIPHAEVFNYIRAMDICIMAKSNWYGSPVKLFEYGLMQKPVIAPDTIPVKDVIGNDIDALITGNDEVSLASAIEKLLVNPELAAKLALNFHNKVLSLYTWEKAAERIISECE